jgi:hypothetical protein
MRPSSIGLSLALCLVAGEAAADPGFLTLDRQDGQSRFGGELTYLILDDSIDATSVRLDLHGHYMTPQGFGFYGDFPISYLSGEGDSATGIGNIELGGIFMPRIANPSFTLAVHAGVTLPTASDDLDPAVANAAAIGGRMVDLALIIPGGLSVRLGLSPMFHSGQFFGRLDAGIDLNLSRTGDGTVDPLIHVNAGVGVDFGTASLTGELINIISTDSDIADRSVSVIGLAVRGVAGSVRPYAGISVPLDSDDTLSDAAITAGIEGVLR